jgi:hypothetical protein
MAMPKDAPVGMSPRQRRADPAAFAGLAWVAFVLIAYLLLNAHYYVLRVGAMVGWH